MTINRALLVSDLFGAFAQIAKGAKYIAKITKI